MTGYLYNAAGRCVQLPVLLSYTVTLTDGEPCDSFAVRFLYAPPEAETLTEACRFTAMEAGKTVFTGVVDEVVLAIGADGRTAEITGRGLGALLRDNQTRGMSFVSAQLPDLLQHFVYPLGIQRVDADAMPPVANYTVESGQSCYQALAGYCRHAADITPRFLPDGTLQLRKHPQVSNREITAATAFSQMRYRVCRYGVLSEQVMVTSRTGAAVTTRNEAFCTAGGQRRGVNLVSGTQVHASDRSAAARIADSMRDYRVLYVTLPGAFLAAPRDQVTVTAPALGISGTFTVRTAESSLSAKGAQCALELS